jgi:aspartyl protease/PDZ domain-containing protein
MLRALSLLALSTTCGGPGPVPQPAPTPAPTPTGPDVALAAAEPLVTPGVVLPSVFSRQHVFLRATVGGIPAVLLFDSGASATILSPRLVRRLDLPYRGRYMAFGIGEPVTGASVYEGTEIRIGPVQLRPSTVLSWADATFPTYGGGVPDGVIGYDLLAASVLMIDVAGGRVVASDTAAPPQLVRPGAREVALRVSHGLPVVQADIFPGGHGSPVPPATASVAVVIDFGAGAGVQLSRSASERLGFPALLRETRVRALIGIGGTVELPEGLADSVRIAGASIPQAVIATDTAETASVALADAEGFVGTEVLRRFAVTLDYARGRAIFEPNALLRMPFCRNAAGICVRTETGLRGAEVVFVDPGSPGARVGIRPRYLILGIDGTSVAQLSVADVDRLLDRAAGALLELVRSTTQIARPEVPLLRGPAQRRAPARDRMSEFVRLPIQ